MIPIIILKGNNINYYFFKKNFNYRSKEQFSYHSLETFLSIFSGNNSNIVLKGNDFNHYPFGNDFIIISRE